MCAKRSWKERSLRVKMDWNKWDSFGLVKWADLKKCFHLRMICQNYFSTEDDLPKLFGEQIENRSCLFEIWIRNEPETSWPPDVSTVKNFQMLILTLILAGNQSNFNTRCRIAQSFFSTLKSCAKCSLKSEIEIKKILWGIIFYFSNEDDSVFN